MKQFDYIRAGANSDVTGTPDATIIAGGTNLLDLMKLEVMTPDRLVDISRLDLKQITPTRDGGLRIGALVTNSDLAADMTVRSDYAALSLPCWRARPVSCATRRPRVATCCNAPAATIFTTPISPVTNATPAPAVGRWRGRTVCTRSLV